MISILVGSLSLTAPLAASAGTGAPAGASCLKFDRSGEIVFTGDPMPAVVTLTDSLNTLAADNPDEVSGVSYCSNYEGAVVFLAPKADSVMAGVTSLASQFPDLTVGVASVPHSKTELDSAALALVEQTESDPAVTSVAPDVTSGSLIVGVAGGSAGLAANPALAARLDTASKQLGIPIKFRQGADATTSYSSRADNPSSFSMGAELVYTAGGTTHVCSTGIPMLLNGQRLLLTAGHCQGSTFSNNGTVVGTNYATSYPANAKTQGDWRLIKGKTYKKQYYSAGIGSSSTKPLTGIYWVQPAKGSHLCTSGRTTGNQCTYEVHVAGMFQKFDGVYTGQQIEMTPIGPAAFAGGDSGGVCYVPTSTGGIVQGSVTGHGPSPYYYCTGTWAVRVWNSAIAFGGS